MLNSKKCLYIFALYFVLYESTTYLSNDMIMPAMPGIIHQFHVSLENVALSLSYFIIGGSALQLFLGPIADIIGKRKVLLFGNLLFLVSTLIIPLSSSMNQFLAARFFQGMGMCFIFIGYAMIHELFDDVDAIKILAILTNISIFAPLLGPVIGSAILSIGRWQFIFIVTGVLGSISFIGLYKYMPKGKIHATEVDIKQIGRSYLNIFTHKIFMLGITTNAISVLPMISWIGLSPTIILENQHRTFTTYVSYQAIIFSGFILSSIIINKVAGKFSFYRLITGGGIITIVGLLIAGLFCGIHTYFVIFGMIIYAFGLGLYSGPLIRISLSSTGESLNLSSSAMSLIICVWQALGLELSNKISHKFAYSITSFALINLAYGILIFLMVKKFAKMNKNRQWETVIIAEGH